MNLISMLFTSSLKISVSKCLKLHNRKTLHQCCRRFTCSMSVSEKDIHDILLDNSTQKHFIEYNGFLSNHLSHGIVALYRLGMSRDRLQHFISWYDKRLEPATNDLLDDSPVLELKGKRVSFYNILKYFEDLLNNKYNKNVDALILNEYPKVSEGLGSSALHGTIHLGYGYAVNNERIILEGLAYTFHSFRPISTSRSDQDFARLGQGSVEITELLEKLRNNSSLQKQMRDGIKEERWKPLKLGRFQIAVTYLTADHADFLTDQVLSIKFDPKLLDIDGRLEPKRCMRQIVYWVIMVFALAKTRNNFFLLHGVTCAWSLNNIIHVLSKDDGLKVIREYLTILLAVYVSQGCPELSVPVLEGEYTENDWRELVKKVTDEDRDEHCYKLLQVCGEMVKEAEKFGENPNIYFQSASMALDKEFHFFSYGD
ncbi:hypothetical protein ACF0H5_015110 [Mactra antiquata]